MIDREIAARARELVEAQRQNTADHELETKYRSLCETLPILLRTAGLTRTVTFLDAKKAKDNHPKNEQDWVLSHLQDQLQASGLYTDASQRTLDLPRFATTRELPLERYRYAAGLAFRVAYWHKRMAQALLRTREGA